MPISHFQYDPEVYDTRSAEKIVPILIEKFHPGSVIDVGCGNAGWLHVFMNLGIEDVLGVDGPWALQNELKIPAERFFSCNIEKPLNLNRKFDLALCLETAEHLEEKFSGQLIENLTLHSDTIIFSAAVPGQPGDGHINLKEPGYWSELFNKKGFYTYDMIRPLIWDDDQIHWWYKQNIFVASRVILNDTETRGIPLILHPEYIHFMTEMEVNSGTSTGQGNQSWLRNFIRKMFKRS